jgi:N6-adenosine-specific RNA methylase IME4
MTRADEMPLTCQIKRERRAARERELAAATLEASRTLGRKLYAVILADPPWSFRAYNEDTGQDRGAVNHYPTMTLDEIKVLPIPAAKDAVLFLWATVPMLPQALEVMTAWGFTYKSSFAWVKDKRGLGFWSRNRHELLLVGTRGGIPCPAPGEQFDSVIEAPRGRHSEKPVIVREMIAQMFPNLPKLEMFARGQRVDGWDLWGNEVEGGE